MKALIAYASKYGSTKGMADFIGEKLRLGGVEADVQDVESVRSLAGYDGFIIGSAVYMFHWMKEAKQFITKNRSVLAQHPVWLFSSGPVGTATRDAKGRDLLEVSGPKELAELQALVSACEHRVFFGSLEGARLTGTIGFAYKLAMKSKSARESMPEGDFRNWQEIAAWAHTISGVLLGLSAASTVSS